jgi:predicted nucleic acid-binding Zn ribbon protein
MSGPDRRGPTPLADVLGALFAARGLGRLGARSELESAWIAAVGEPAASQTRVGGVRHGVLTVNVAHPTLLEELAAFRKSELLAALRQNAPGSPIHDIRFRVGPIDAPEAVPDPPPAPRSRRPRRGG